MPDSRQTDKRTLGLLRARDPQTLAALVQEHARPLYRAARAMGFRDDEAENLVQDVLTTFLETLDRFEGRSQVRTWLFGIFHRKVFEQRRESYREERHDPIDEVFESRFDRSGEWARPPADLHRILESKEIGLVIEECLNRLPAAQKEVFVLREMEGADTGEICKILGISATNMSVLLHRARARLRECVERKGWGRK